jgi:hydroxypyruvate reductase
VRFSDLARRFAAGQVISGLRMTDPLLVMLHAALAAVEPGHAVRQHVHRNGSHLVLSDGRQMPLGRRTIVIGAGKASAPMAAALEDLLADHLDTGVVVVKQGHTCPLQRIRLIEAGHPVPDDQGLVGAETLLRTVAGLAPEDLVICALSGGASALLPAPVAGLGLAGKQAVTRLLLASGADIQAVNTVRKHLSLIKGGRLALRAHPATVLTLAISDVVGDDWGTIGCGPTVADPTTLAEARLACQTAGIWEALPPAARAALMDPAQESPKPDHPCFAGAWRLLVASNDLALSAVVATSQGLGYRALRDSQPLRGEATEAARRFVSQAAELARSGQATALIAGGETTVTLGAHPGLGGRNQEFALAAALALEDLDPALSWRIRILAAGTDGNDGPTDAAGGLVDAGTATRARQAGRDPQRDLQSHDAYPCLDAGGALLHTGPTRTNVMDIAVALIAA